MRKTILYFFTLTLLVSSLNSFSINNKVKYEITVEQIKKKLQDKPPVDVGFDIDDTILDPSQLFKREYENFSKRHSDKNDDQIQKEFIQDDIVWNNINNCENNDILKIRKVATKLIHMHLERKDRIHFITNRPKTKNEQLTEFLQKNFNIPEKKMNKVIFATQKVKDKTLITNGLKTFHIKRLNIARYYGDSDSDITDARNANALGIRVKRPSNSWRRPFPVYGSLGEDVINETE